MEKSPEDGSRQDNFRHQTLKIPTAFRDALNIGNSRQLEKLFERGLNFSLKLRLAEKLSQFFHRFGQVLVAGQQNRRGADARVHLDGQGKSNIRQPLGVGG